MRKTARKIQILTQKIAPLLIFYARANTIWYERYEQSAVFFSGTEQKDGRERRRRQGTRTRLRFDFQCVRKRNRYCRARQKKHIQINHKPRQYLYSLQSHNQDRTRRRACGNRRRNGKHPIRRLGRCSKQPKSAI